MDGRRDRTGDPALDYPVKPLNGTFLSCLLPILQILATQGLYTTALSVYNHVIFVWTTTVETLERTHVAHHHLRTSISSVGAVIF